MSITNSFDEYFNSTGTGTKIGELKDKECKITGVSEYKSQKSGKTSIKVTIDCDGTEIRTFLGFSTEAAVKISLSRLTRIAAAAVGREMAEKMFNESCQDEDVNTDEELILDYAVRVNKKLKKNPVTVLVDRVKDEQGFWNTKYRIPGDESAKEDSKDEEKPQAQSTGTFFDDLK